MGGSHNLLKSLGLVKVNKSSDDAKKVRKAKGRKWKFWKSSVHAANDKQEVVVVRKPNYPRGSEDWAAVVIQTAFRGFKARRALRAIKGVVRLQALVRGRTVRKQASITLRCMQTLVKVQRARQTRLSEASAMRAIAQRQLPPVDRTPESEKKWMDSVRTKEEIRTRIQQKHEAAVKRERALAYAFSHQWRAHPRPPTKGTSEPPEWEWGWLERWMASRPWENHAVEEALKNGAHLNTTKSPAQPKEAPGGDSLDSPKSVQSNGAKNLFHPTPSSDKSSPRSTKASSKANGIEKPVVKSRYMDHFKVPEEKDKANRPSSLPKQRPSKDQAQVEEDPATKKRLSLPTPPKSPLITTTPKKKA